MKIVFKNPIDIFICIICSLLLLPLVFLNIEGVYRIVLGLPFIFFIPGYVTLCCLFPAKKIAGGLDNVERIAFSFGLSMAIIPIIGIFLYYSPFGLRIEPILLSLFFIIITIAILALIRWYQTPLKEGFTLSLTISLQKSNTKLDRILNMILFIIIIITIITVVFVVLAPKKTEKLTEFYLLGPGGKTADYPKNLSIGENAKIIIGLINHEHKTINYTIEIWLINQTIVHNTSTNQNDTMYNEMWFIDRISVTLPHFTERKENIWSPQWEYPYNFRMNRTGNYTLTFLLFTTPPPTYNSTENYRTLAEEKIIESYENLRIKLNVY